MTQTTINLPDDLMRLAEQEAARRGISLSEVVREALLHDLANARAADPMLDDDFVSPVDSPADLSARVDDHLYGKG